MKPLVSSKIILIGASTGGPGVIEKLLSGLPQSFRVPICIVQHFPSDLTHSFVSRLQTCTSNLVVESSEGLHIKEKMIVVAKGGRHIGFVSGDYQSSMIIETLEGIRNDFIPSVDVMMLSAVEVYTPSSILAILLTGIGDDGADGMVKIKELGGYCIAQDEKSSPVFGMPGRAIERGGASIVLSSDEIIDAIIKFGTV
jgi:two-component system, chemotaxis family, protein-glutamate methylesterase/glutaminase